MTQAAQELTKFQEQARDIRGRHFRKIPAVVTKYLYAQNSVFSARTMRLTLQYVMESFYLKDCGNLTYQYRASRTRRPDNAIVFNYKDLDKWFWHNKKTHKKQKVDRGPLVTALPASDFDHGCPNRESFRKALNWLRRAWVLDVTHERRGRHLGSCLLIHPCFSRIHEILTLSDIPELVEYKPSVAFCSTEPQPLKTKEKGFQLFSEVYYMPETVSTALGLLKECLRDYRDDAMTVSRLQQAIIKGFMGKHLTILEIKQLHVEVMMAGGPGNARYSENEDVELYEARCSAADAAGRPRPRQRLTGQRRFCSNLTVDQFINCPQAIRADLLVWQEQSGKRGLCFYANWVPIEPVCAVPAEYVPPVTRADSLKAAKVLRENMQAARATLVEISEAATAAVSTILANRATLANMALLAPRRTL